GASIRERTEVRVQDRVLEDMTAVECQALLAQHHLGRLAFLDGTGRPMIIPLNYVLQEGEVVFRTAPDSKVAAAGPEAAVAFEVDGFEEEHRVGWSVVVRGHLEPLSAPAGVQRLQQTPLVVWAPGARDHFVRVTATSTSGRRVSVADIPSQWWG
ncbi:MAG: pyridoxamine 5'-phosphate oxidase family protein, partial [Actinomycetes bacterium]